MRRMAAVSPDLPRLHLQHVAGTEINAHQRRPIAAIQGAEFSTNRFSRTGH